jgi:hypothetical protein
VADVDRQQSRIVSPETLSAIVLNVDSVIPEGITPKNQATNFIVRQAPRMQTDSRIKLWVVWVEVVETGLRGFDIPVFR